MSRVWNSLVKNLVVILINVKDFLKELDFVCTVELLHPSGYRRLVRLYCFDTVTHKEIRLILKPVLDKPIAIKRWHTINMSSLMDYLTAIYLDKSISIYNEDYNLFISPVYKTIYDKYTVNIITSPASKLRVFAIQISDVIDVKRNLCKETVKAVDAISIADISNILNDQSYYYSINQLIVNAMETARQRIFGYEE